MARVRVDMIRVRAKVRVDRLRVRFDRVRGVGLFAHTHASNAGLL